jgi:protein-S-isoprenylcysteine O-methyltransferase Ste14
VAAFWANRTEKRVITWETALYRIAILAGAVLLFPGTARRLHLYPLWHVGFAGAYALALLALAGLLFTWWARVHLGRLWSGSITRKEGHHVVDTGPYGLVRHPIYTGVIFALFATAAAQATVTALAGAALITFGFWLKARIDDQGCGVIKPLSVTTIHSPFRRLTCRTRPSPGMMLPAPTKKNAP